MAGATTNEEDVVEEDWSNFNHGSDFEYYGTHIFLLSAIEEETITNTTGTIVQQHRPLQMLK